MNTSALILHYKNEKNTNQLLKYPTNLISNIMNLLNKQTEHINNINNNMDREYLYIYELEYERYNYFISQILLVRLNKIMKYIYSDSLVREMLSDGEMLFRQKYIKLMSLDTVSNNIIMENNLEKEIVSFVCNTDLGVYLIDGNEVFLKEGEFYVCGVNDVMGLIHEGSIELV
ncbi:DNA replication complex GINS protein SLD5 [Cucumispora dikerogammari]|nr:DNA replication complex GINS protein SLD5 [Cucumispora dikerogammari]